MRNRFGPVPVLTFLAYILIFAAGFIIGSGRARRVHHTMDHYHFHDQQVSIEISVKDDGASEGEEWRRS